MATKKKINFIAIGLSFIFMFNPNINIIDILPDFIGYIILCVMLTSLGDINESISEALVIFKRMIFIDAAKLLALMWVFGISVTSEYNSSLMLWSFVFGVIEIIFLIPAYVKLFKGLAELGYFHSNTSIIGTKTNSKRNYTDKIRSFTVFFVLLKSTMSFLPELSDLTSTEYYENQGMTNLYQYIGIMRLLAFVPVMIVGAIWFIRILIYFKRINDDKEFCTSIEQIYNEKIYPKNGIFVKRNVALSFAILLTALAFSFDLRIENVNILPDFISAILIFVFFCIIAKKTLISKGMGLILPCGYFVTSLIASYFEYSFFKDYYYGAIYRNTAALNSFRVMVVTAIINIVVFAVTCLFVIKVIDKVIDTHTGYVLAEKKANLEMQNKMAEATRAELKKKLTFCLVATVIYSAGDICYVLFAKDYGFMLLINVVCTVVFIGAYVKTYFEIYEAVSTKYMLE